MNEAHESEATAGNTPGAAASRTRFVAWGSVLRWALRGVLALVVLIVLFLGLTPLGRYLVKAGWAEAKILAGRRPIADVIADTGVTPAIRKKLQLVLDARAFASSG